MGGLQGGKLDRNMRGFSFRLLFRLAFPVTLVAAAVLAWRFVVDHPPEKQMSLFEDVASTSGITYTGLSHGAAWGDFDGDGMPDHCVTSHLNTPQLYRYLVKGRLEDATGSRLSSPKLTDGKHGAAWGRPRLRRAARSCPA